MTMTHICPSCAIFATAPGTCPHCDVELVALDARSESSPSCEGQKPAPCPDLDVEDSDRASRTVQPTRVRKPRTRRAAVAS